MYWKAQDCIVYCDVLLIGAAVVLVLLVDVRVLLINVCKSKCERKETTYSQDLEMKINKLSIIHWGWRNITIFAVACGPYVHNFLVNKICSQQHWVHWYVHRQKLSCNHSVSSLDVLSMRHHQLSVAVISLSYVIFVACLPSFLRPILFFLFTLVTLYLSSILLSMINMRPLPPFYYHNVVSR